MFSTCASFQRVGRSRTRNTVFLGDTSRRKRKSLCHSRSSPRQKKDVSFLTNLPGASEKLNIFNVDPSNPESLNAAIEGCVGIFHTATPVDFEVNEPEEVVTKRTIDGALGFLRACKNSKTLKRVVYTSSGSAVSFQEREEDGLDVVTLVPNFAIGPFICSKLPSSIYASMPFLFGDVAQTIDCYN
ncbi:vestitone reductase-like [Lathyrus oleraceus]|uniref:vestitone reductase-like n=1 Tax=Pisum sativum TaxID=3888 RepID=UPI0021D29964|nr:vestitone reductase-like [Pisum sativum]